MDYAQFTQMITTKGAELFRPMPWRADTRPYYILVSEIMLQQTQVERVKVKFSEFITAFPDSATLANAPLADVLRHWNGLGYNRRARYLHEAAKYITQHYDGALPQTTSELVNLPGVGKNTAGAIMTYAYNTYTPFVETNIRTVYFHHFFANTTQVSDATILELLEKTVDKTNPRAFYWALMDYGTILKKQGYGNQTKSIHYKKQSPLKGSVREVRGQIVKALAQKPHTDSELRAKTTNDSRFNNALTALIAEKLVEKHTDYYHLSN